MGTGVDIVEVLAAREAFLALYRPGQLRNADGEWSRTGGGGIRERSDKATKPRASMTAAKAAELIGLANASTDEGGLTSQQFAAKFRTLSPGDKERVWRNLNKRGKAKASYKEQSSEKNAFAMKTEAYVARALRGKNLPDCEAADVIVSSALGRKVALEVKTVCEGSIDKITMHPDSLRRKLSARGTDVDHFFTVVKDGRKEYKGGNWEHIDARTGTVTKSAGKKFYSGHDFYFSTTVGSPRFPGPSFVKVRNEAHLRTLVRDAVRAKAGSYK
jgi:hypothetical protein